MELNNEQISKLKEKELDLFKAFIDVCEKLNLKYYVVGGTLLGAVRHKGFIPWDDDIDLAMLREDYEIFISEGPKYLPEHMFIQTIYSDPAYLLNMAKIRNSRTTFIETSVKDRKINHGIFIDIFPQDYYLEDKELKKFSFFNWLYSSRVYLEFNLKTNENIKTKIFNFVLKLIFPDVNKVLHKREKLYKKGTNKNIIVSNCGVYGDKEHVPAEWFGEGAKLIFEGIEVNAPSQYDKLLTHMYGDYMQLPPEEKRRPHHYVEAVDFEKSYKEVK